MAIQITSKRDGFWRCGIQHSDRPTTYADKHFTKKELERLKAEAMLVVVEVAGEPEDEKTKDKG